MRVLLKLSGELLSGKQEFGINMEACLSLASAIKEMQHSGIQLGIVIGGGNIYRGIDLRALGMQQTPADQMGMLATMMNGIALREALKKTGCDAKVFSALECPRLVESYNWSLVNEVIKNQVVIFVGGTGNPYFTTDTAAALRAGEIHAELLLKATKVDGIYTKDPLKNPDAKKFSRISYSDFLAQKLEVMDASAVAMCRKSNIPIYVFNMGLLGKIPGKEIISQQHLGTIVNGE